MSNSELFIFLSLLFDSEAGECQRCGEDQSVLAGSINGSFVSIVVYMVVYFGLYYGDAFSKNEFGGSENHSFYFFIFVALQCTSVTASTMLLFRSQTYLLMDLSKVCTVVLMSCNTHYNNEGTPPH